MSKKLLLFFVFLPIGSMIFSLDLLKINSTLGPKSFTFGLYGGYLTNNIGANFEWGIDDSPLVLGIGFSPFVLGEYAIRIGYHPDFNIKGLDLYANIK